MNHGTLLVFEVTILVLAIFLGFEVISKVPTLLHTPLMSGTNAIHGIVIVGAMLVAGTATDSFTKVIGFLAVILASANVVGGFVVTDRMLEMFKKREPPKPAADDSDSTGACVSKNLTDLLYLVTIVTFILALHFLSSPATARRGNQLGALGMMRRRRRHVRAAGDGKHVADRARDGPRRRLRRGRGAPREDDRDAADGGAVQRRRRRRGRPHLDGGVPQPGPAARPPARRHQPRDRALGPDRQRLVLGQHDRLRQAPGADPGPADHLPGPEGREPRPAGEPPPRSVSRSAPAGRPSGRSRR